MRYGIIGCGYSGGIHADNILKLPAARLVGVYDVDAGRAAEFAKEKGTTVFSSPEELCGSGEVDAILVTVPNDSHLLPAVCAARGGKHVFCEKPVALWLEAARQMVKAADEAGVIFFAAHVTNFISGVRRAKRLLASGEIGRLLMIEAVHTDWAGPQKQVSWKQRKAVSGGHLYHHMHEVDLICQLSGLPVSVFGRGGNLAHSGPGFGDEEDAAFLTMELSGGGFASLTIGSAFHLGDHYVKLQGERGGILLDFKGSSVRLENENGSLVYSMQESPQEDEERRAGYQKNRLDAGKGFGRPGMKTALWMETIFRKELECFDRAVRTGQVEPEYGSLFDGTAALQCVKTLNGASESMKTGRPVRLEDE